MTGTEGDEVPPPLMEPRFVRFLKKRPRLIDRGVREEFLDELERNMRERRRPDTMAEKTVQQMFERIEEAGGGVARNRATKALDKANKGPLKRL